MDNNYFFTYKQSFKRICFISLNQQKIHSGTFWYHYYQAPFDLFSKISASGTISPSAGLFSFILVPHWLCRVNLSKPSKYTAYLFYKKRLKSETNSFFMDTAEAAFQCWILLDFRITKALVYDGSMWSIWHTGASASWQSPPYWSSVSFCGSTAGQPQNIGTAMAFS